MSRWLDADDLRRFQVGRGADLRGLNQANQANHLAA